MREDSRRWAKGSFGTLDTCGDAEPLDHAILYLPLRHAAIRLLLPLQIAADGVCLCIRGFLGAGRGTIGRAAVRRALPL